MTFTKFSHSIDKIYEIPICVVCFEKNSDSVFALCGHYCCCNNCADKIRNSNNECPICRKKIKQVILRNDIHIRKVEDSVTLSEIVDNFTKGLSSMKIGSSAEYPIVIS